MKRTGTTLYSKPQILSINLAKFLGPAAGWAVPCRNLVCRDLTLSVCPFQLYWQEHFGFSQTSLERRLNKANGAAWSCIVFCKKSPHEHHPGRWNEPDLVFSIFFSLLVDCLVCTRKPPRGTLLWKANVIKKDKWFLQKTLDKQFYYSLPWAVSKGSLNIPWK